MKKDFQMEEKDWRDMYIKRTGVVFVLSRRKLADKRNFSLSEFRPG